MHKTSLDYFLLDFDSQGINPQTVLSSAHAPQTLLFPEFWLICISLADTNLLHSRLPQLKGCLCFIRLRIIIQRLKPLLYKDLISKIYSLTATKVAESNFLPDLKDRGVSFLP